MALAHFGPAAPIGVDQDQERQSEVDLGRPVGQRPAAAERRQRAAGRSPPGAVREGKHHQAHDRRRDPPQPAACAADRVLVKAQGERQEHDEGEGADETGQPVDPDCGETGRERLREVERLGVANERDAQHQRRGSAPARQDQKDREGEADSQSPGVGDPSPVRGPRFLLRNQLQVGGPMVLDHGDADPLFDGDRLQEVHRPVGDQQGARPHALGRQQRLRLDGQDPEGATGTGVAVQDRSVGDVAGVGVEPQPNGHVLEVLLQHEQRKQQGQGLPDPARPLVLRQLVSLFAVRRHGPLPPIPGMAPGLRQPLPPLRRRVCSSPGRRRRTGTFAPAAAAC